MRFPIRALRTLALASALSALLHAPARAQPAPADFSLCRRNALLDFFVPEAAGDPAARETSPTDFEARSVTALGETRYTLEGDVVVRRADQRIAAARMDYERESERVVAEGDVRYQDARILVGATRIQSDLASERTELDDVRYQLLAARGNGTAERGVRHGDARTELSRVSYSTCDPEDRDWEFLAREIELDHEKGEGRARGMRLKFKGATLLALPYATFPIDDRRRSGFLYPQIGYSEEDGLDLAVPYYLNLAPNYDLTLVPRILSQRGFMAGAEFRYLTPRHRGELRGTYLPDDDEAGGRDRWALDFDHHTTLSERFHIAADINRVSDDRYFEDFGDSLTAAATSLLPSSAYLHGRGRGWALAFGGDDYEVTDPRLPQAFEPYRRLPRFTLETLHRFGQSFETGLRSELVSFDKDDALTGERYDLEPWVAFPYERAAGFVRPELGYRWTAYELDRDANASPSRGVPIASVDAGLVFERDTALFGDRLTQTLEPRLFYLYVPDEAQDDLPVFDTQELTFSFAQLFRRNRFSGADRQTDANNLTLAVTTRLLDDERGEERLRASIGQIRYFDDQDVQLPGVPARDASASAWAAELDFGIWNGWRLALAQQYDPEDSHTDLSAFRVQKRFAEDRGVFNAAYRYRRDFLEQVDLSAAFPINERFRLVGRYNYSLRDERTLEAFAGLEYGACCFAVRLLGRHYVRTVEGDSTNAIYLELELRGLGSLGRRSGDFLRESIAGYR